MNFNFPELLVRISLFLVCPLLWCATPAAWSGQPTALTSFDFSFAEPYFETLNDNESLPYGVVTAVAQDASGLIWIGTQNGLVSFDGYRFTKYVHNPADPASLSGDFVNCLWAAPDGRIWVGTNGQGISIFDSNTGHFNNLLPNAKDARSLHGGNVMAIVSDAAGGRWTGTDQGLNYLAAGASGFVHYQHEAGNVRSVANDHVRSLLMSSRGVLWIGSDDGLQKMRGSQFERVETGQTRPVKIRAMFEASDGKLWLGSGTDGGAWLKPDELKLHWVNADGNGNGKNPQASIHTIVQPSPDRIWLGTFGNGITVVSADDGRVVQQVRHNQAMLGTLALDIIGAMLVDRSAQLWIGTWGGGLQRNAASNLAFRTVRNMSARSGQSAGLSDPDVHSVVQTRSGQILVGSNGVNIDIVDRIRGVIGQYRPLAGTGQDLSGDKVLSMAITPDGALWAGTQLHGVLRQTPGTDHWTIFATGSSPAQSAVNTLLVSKSGELYAGCDSGIVHWNAPLAKFERYAVSDTTPAQSAVYALEEDRAGRIWIGTMQGLWVLDPKQKTLRVLHHDPDQPGSISVDLIGGLLTDHDGQLWVSTANGLDRLKSLDEKHAEFVHVSAQAGQAGQNFGSNLLQDKQQRIWSEDHLYDPVSNRVTELTRADGLDIGTAWTGSYARTSDGLFLYGGTRGLVMINPDQFQPWSDQPPLRAVELKINGIVQPAGLLQPGLTLQPAERNFSIEFAALDFSTPQKNRYSYRLLGYDDAWINTDSAHRSASYGNLWPGHYTLQVRGTNRSGDWSPHELAIPIVVLPAFWQTSWFMLVALLAAGGAMYGIYRWRVVVLSNKAAQLQSLVALRTAELREKNRELELLAVTDRLTRLCNRLKLEECHEEQIARAERYATHFALILLDIDQFKSINDLHGHQTGDKVLVEFAAILTAHSREIDVIGRWGGEEFMIIASDTKLDGAVTMAEKLRVAIAEYPFTGPGHCTASFGVTGYEAGDSLSGMLARADRALYRAKENGRNQVQCGY